MKTDPLKKYLDENKIMKAILLAAGEGKRLWPLSQSRPKVMMPICGKPLILRIVQALEKNGVNEIAIVVKYKQEIIRDFFKSNKTKAKITFFEQGNENGTAKAIESARDFVDSEVLVLAADGLINEKTIDEFIRKSKNEKGLCAAIKKVEDPKNYGVAVLKNKVIEEMEEKPQKPKSNLANISIYKMDKETFEKIEKIKKSPRGDYQITDILIGAIGIKIEGYWRDIAYPWELLDANADYLKNLSENKGEIKSSTINGKIIMEKGSKIINSFIEGEVYVCEGAIIGPNAYIRGPSVIGRNCKIGPGSSVKSSVLFDGVCAKHLTYIGDSVIGEGVNFGSGSQIANYRFDSKPVNVLSANGIICTGRKKMGAVIGDFVKFGVLSSVMPGKMIGPNSLIHTNVIVNENIPDSSDVFVKQQLEIRKKENRDK